MPRKPRLPEVYRQVIFTARLRDGTGARRRARVHLAAVLPATLAGARRQRNGKAKVRHADLSGR